MLGFLIEWLRSLLFTRHLDVCIVGLPGAGKTTLTNVLVTGRVPEHVAPTVGYNLRQLRVGNVRMRLWDIGYVFYTYTVASRVSGQCGSDTAPVYRRWSSRSTRASPCRPATRPKTRASALRKKRRRATVTARLGILRRKNCIRSSSGQRSPDCLCSCWRPKTISRIPLVCRK